MSASQFSLLSNPVERTSAGQNLDSIQALVSGMAKRAGCSHCGLIAPWGPQRALARQGSSARRVATGVA